MLAHYDVPQGGHSLEKEAAIENPIVDANTIGLINNQLNEEKSFSENESPEDFYNIELNSEKFTELAAETCGEQMSYAWKIGGITGTFISTMAHCVGYIVERDLSNGYSAKYYTVPYAASLIAPPVIGGLSYLLSSHPHFKAGSASFIISGLMTGAVDSLVSLSFPDAPYAPASIVIPTLTAMTLINVVSPEVCLHLPTVTNKLAKLSSSCFSFFKSKLENAEQRLIEANIDEESPLTRERRTYGAIASMG
jgi:hypothetical protein